MTNKTIVLTGACGGIGKAIASVLDEQGHYLILVDRQQDQLTTLNAQLHDKHLCVQADLSSQDGIDAVVRACEQEANIDMLINCAGISHFALFANTSIDKIQQMFAVNVISVMNLCQALLPLLKQQSNASIINVGSTFGSIGYPGFSAYCASKFAIRGFSEALRRELADTNIDVRYFAPRATQTSINTDQVVTMNKQLGVQMDSPEHVAKALLGFIQQKSARNYFVGWPEKLFVKINALFPVLVEKSIIKQLPIIKTYL